MSLSPILIPPTPFPSSKNLASPLNPSKGFGDHPSFKPSKLENPRRKLFFSETLVSMADHPSESDKKARSYHPYQDLHVPVKNLYHLPTSPEYLFDEEAAIQRRSWGENLQYYTGSGYLTGAIVGAAKGSIEGIKAAEPGDSLKLRINRVLNSGGQTGRRFGNSLGVVGLIFAGLESGLIHFRDTDDMLNSVLAGLGTGALYKAAYGPRSAAVAGAVGGLAAGIAVAGKQVFKRYVPV